jgi:hypothetical protein
MAASWNWEGVVAPKRRLPVDVTAVARAMADGDRSQKEYLLDTHTGELLALPRAALDAALEGAASDTLAPELRAFLTRAKAVARARPGHYVIVPQRPPPDVFDVMQRFVASVTDAELRRNLQRALGGHAPFRRFKEVLSDDVPEEERWESYGDTVRQIEAREWLDGLDLEPIDE